VGAFLFVGVVLMFRILPGRWQIAAPLLVGGVSLVLFGLFFRRFNHDAASMLTHGFGLRVRIATEGLQLFLEDPLFGVGTGPDAFREAYARTFPSSPRYFEHAHNQVVHILATRGILGIATFLALIVAAGTRLLRAVRPPANGTRSPEGGEMATWAFTGACAIAGMLANGIFERPLAEGNEVLFWMLPALGLASLHPPETTGHSLQQVGMDDSRND
jgi:O-antigen ligase